MFGRRLGPYPPLTAVRVVVTSAALLFGTVVAPLAGEMAKSDRRAEIAANVREGVSARAGFEAVVLSSNRMIEGRRIHATYHLDTDPDAYDVDGRGLEHLDRVTFSWSSDERVPFIFEFVLHGDLETGEGLAFRIPELDIRKFLPQSLAHDPETESLAPLQAYFAELSRKAKIIYPLGRSDGRAAATPFEAESRLWLQRELAAFMRVEADEDRASTVGRLLAALESGGMRRMGVIERNLSLLASGAPTPGAKLALARAADRVTALAAVAKVSDMVLTNNCREPGNYEIALRDLLGRRLIQGAFSVPADLYDAILMRYHGIGIRDQGAGLELSTTIAATDPQAYVFPFPEWAGRRFPSVQAADLARLRSTGTISGLGTYAASGLIAVNTGAIPYREYENEVRFKSAFERSADEPLSYVRVDLAKSPPVGFVAPDGMSSTEYWSAPASSGKVVAHRFLRFDELWLYDVHLSGFETSGVYSGKSDLTDFDRERQEGRWAFDFQYLADLERYDLRQTGAGWIEIRLLTRAGAKRPVGFVAGNLDVPVGEVVEIPFGIGTQPLIAPYDENPFQDPIRYVVAVGENGIVLDHHRTDVGVERMVIEHEKPGQYRVRLVSHERIMPVWEGVIATAIPLD